MRSVSVMSFIINFLISSIAVLRVWLSLNLDKIVSRFFLYSNKDSYGIDVPETPTLFVPGLCIFVFSIFSEFIKVSNFYDIDVR